MLDGRSKQSVLALALLILPLTSAQSAEPAKQGQSFEGEFAASNVFQTGTLIIPIVRKLAFEGHYFGGEATDTDTGFTGASWMYRWKELELMPGFGVVFGSNNFTTSPAVSFRWSYEKRWFITQGLIVQSFRSTPVFEEGDPDPLYYVRPTISDGSHISARWKRLTIGGTAEKISFREGVEWKGGGRLAFRIFPRISAVLYVLAPGKTEWRAGILIHPHQN